MKIDELKTHLDACGYASALEEAAGGQRYLVITGVSIGAGSHAGNNCSVGIPWSTEEPWVPHPSVHVRPHLVKMGERGSQASNLGADWQYLSRRFDRPPTPRAFVAHIVTVLSEL